MTRPAKAVHGPSNRVVYSLATVAGESEREAADIVLSGWILLDSPNVLRGAKHKQKMHNTSTHSTLLYLHKVHPFLPKGFYRMGSTD